MQTIHYTPLHPEVYSWKEEFLNPSLRDALKSGKKQDLLSVLEPRIHGVYTFKCFTPEFCDLLLEELTHLENRGAGAKHPNSMNNYGMILDNVNFTSLIELIMNRIITPFASILFKENNGDKLKYHHAFTVRYKVGEDVQLKKHMDDADVTLNICLGKTFEGGKLFFKGLKDSSIQKISGTTHRYQVEEQEYDMEHEKGAAFIHLGRHIHGARPLTNGERVNLIIWCKATPYT